MTAKVAAKWIRCRTIVTGSVAACLLMQASAQAAPPVSLGPFGNAAPTEGIEQIGDIPAVVQTGSQPVNVAGVMQAGGDVTTPSPQVSQVRHQTTVSAATPPKLAAAPRALQNNGEPLDLGQIQLNPGETLVPGPGINPVPSYGVGPNAPVPMGYQAGCPCPRCPDRRFVSGEALYVKRAGDNFFSLGDRFALDEFDFDWGVRVTAGYIMECTDAIDITYTGLTSWNNSALATGNAQVPLNLRIPRNAAIPANQVDTFYNAQAQSQVWEARYNSVEINQRSWGWDVISLLHGIRVINYEESFAFRSANFLNQQGLINHNTDNILIGLQIGIDMLYPVAQRVSTGIRARAAGFANFAEQDVRVVNNGFQLLNNTDDDIDIAGLLELGVNTRFHLTRNISFTSGYEVWYMTQIATVPGNTPTQLISTYGRNIDTDEDVFFHGFTAGVELKW